MTTRRAFVRGVALASGAAAGDNDDPAQPGPRRVPAPQRDYVLQMMKELPYSRWREFDPADTLRYYALRLREAGMIKASPQKILADATDWRFLNELEKEMKG